MAEQPNKKALYTYHHEGCRCDGLALHVIERETQYKIPGLITLCFDGTDRGHMLDGKIIERTEDGFTFQRESGELFSFQECTLERFKSSVYKNVGNGANIAAAMADTADLWEWYRKEYPLDPTW